MGAFACYFLPNLGNLPTLDLWGFPIALFLHIFVFEPLFYLSQRLFHSDYFFKNYHFIHHFSPVPRPFTAEFATPLEQIVIGVVMGVPIVGSFFGQSWIYWSCLCLHSHVRFYEMHVSHCHSNIEVFPSAILDTFPLLRYLIYTPTRC